MDKMTHDRIDLTLPLEGTEGLDVNYISRVRTQYLYAQHQALITQTQFADAKAAALLALVGILSLRGPIPVEEMVTRTWLDLAYLIANALTILFCFMAVFPRYPPQAVREQMAKMDRWSWPALASNALNDADFARFMQTSEVSELVHSVARSNSRVSTILLKKFRMLRMAFFAGASIVALAGVRLAGLA